MKQVILEHFHDIYKFVDTIGNRENNPIMKNKHSSESETDGEWAGTKTYGEARNLMENGVESVANELKTLEKRIKCNTNVTKNRAIPRNYYTGYAPNVARALENHPKSMRQMARVPQKVKAISIIFDCSQNAGYGGEVLQKAGKTVFSLVFAAEMSGYRVKLSEIVMTAYANEEKVLCLLDLKDFRQPFDALKLSFPLTNQAIFRRFGFKWLETLDKMTEKGFAHGYGGHMEKSTTIECLDTYGYDTKNTHIIAIEDCKKANFDYEKLAKNLKISL